MKALRINKYLAGSGVASRRKADSLVQEGRIRLNGKVVTELGTLVDPRRDRVDVDGVPVQGLQGMSYIIVNKPSGYVTTARDPQGRPTVLDLVPAVKNRIYPVGRLDYDSEGLLFLLNDGPLAFRLTHPKYEVEKTYRVRLEKPIETEALEAIRRGVVLEDGPTAPARIAVAGASSNSLDITIHEGRNRQVRRVFESVGSKVIHLKRVRFGTIELGAMAPGSWREMTPDEVRSLRKLVGIT